MIAPQTDVYLLNTVLENDGVNTLTWSSETRQRNYFISCRVFTLSNFLYQRQDRAIKVEIPVDTLYGSVNYVMYRNTGYTNKWFYAFIDRLEYVNDNTTLIYIRTDEFQTWQFDLVYRTSYVIREHTNDDTIGANRLDEGLGLGNYVCEKKETMWDSRQIPRIAMLAPVNKVTATDTQVNISYQYDHDWYTVNPSRFYNRVGTQGCFVIQYMISQTDILLISQEDYNQGEPRNPIQTWTNVYLRDYGITLLDENHIADTGYFAIVATQSGGTITTESYVSYLSHNILGYSFQMAPMRREFVQNWIDELNDQSLSDDVGALYLIPPDTCGSPITRSNDTVTKQTKTFTLTRTLDGYTPKNKKLLCYPYTVVKMHNASDGRRVLAPELFYSYGNCGFEFWSSFQPGCTVISVPLNYAGVAESLEYALNSAKFPLSAARYNGFQNWLGIHATERNIRIAGGIANMAVSAIPFLTNGVGIQEPLDMDNNASGWFGTSASRNGYYDSGRRSGAYITNVNTMSRYQATRGLVGSAVSLAQTLAEDNARQKERFQTIGSIDNNNLNAVNDINIYLEQQTITYDYAKRIDDYFSMYGYKTNMLKVPNITGRRNWNYVQLRSANVIGSIPNDSLDNIRAMLINGVTFWHNPSTYLDYTQNNDII